MTGALSHAVPTRILLATDLSCRCDRALDRAVLLAGEWRAGLVAVHVMESAIAPAGERWRGASAQDPVAIMRRRIAADLATLADDVPGIDVRVATGEPADRIVEIAEREGCGLIVTGVARDEELGRMFVGTTVNRLVRRARVPVLVVRERPRQPYRDILVATDFSETSRQALVRTVGLFPEAAITLMHGLDLPLPPGHIELPEEDCRAMEREQRAAFLDTTPIDPAIRGRIGLRVRRGDPERVIADHARDHRVDLTVVGSHGRGALFDLVIGSMTKRLLERVEGDMLIVVDPRARREDGA